jgi:hypothetical protein
MKINSESVVKDSVGERLSYIIVYLVHYLSFWRRKRERERNKEVAISLHNLKTTWRSPLMQMKLAECIATLLG